MAASLGKDNVWPAVAMSVSACAGVSGGRSGVGMPGDIASITGPLGSIVYV